MKEDSLKKPDSNIITGNWLIEHDPGAEGQHYCIYDLRLIGANSDGEIFWCWTKADAIALCAALDRVGITSNPDKAVSD